MPGARRALRNVWYDTAASPLIFPTARIFTAALACVAPQKLLFASDYPLRLYPSRQEEPDMRPFLAELGGLGWDEATRAAIMGGNAAALLGLSAPSRTAGQKPASVPSPRVAPAGPPEGLPMTADEGVSLTAHAFPSTQAVFDLHGIPWRDEPAPYWEPIRQAAAARGYGPEALRKLVAELNEAAGATPG